MNTPAHPLHLLATQLKACPAQDTIFSPKRLIELWSSFRQFTPEEGAPVTPAILVALILQDQNHFGLLLNETERAQLTALGKVALERYQQKAHPLNQLGHTMAAAIKESL